MSGQQTTENQSIANRENAALSVDLRDYFAAAIMQGLMASQCEVGVPYPIYAYAISDSMLKAREAK